MASLHARHEQLLRSASRQAQEALREQENAVFDSPGGFRAKTEAGHLVDIADELYSVANLLAGQPRLRRTLGDPAAPEESRAQLIEQLIGGQVSKQTLQLCRAAVSLRWSTPWDLADAIEGAGDDALFAAAEKAGSVAAIEDELFRFERILQSEGEVAGLLDAYAVDTERRTALLDSLVQAKVSPITLQLLRHAVASQRKRSITLAIDDLLEKAAERQERSVARVTERGCRCPTPSSCGSRRRSLRSTAGRSASAPPSTRRARRADRARRRRGHRRQRRHPLRRGPRGARRLTAHY